MTSNVIEIHETNDYHFYLLPELLKSNNQRSIIDPILAVYNRSSNALVVPKILLEDLGKALCKMLEEDHITGSHLAILLIILKGEILKDISPGLRKDIEAWMVLHEL